MSTIHDTLRVVYGSDDNYAKFMGISMYSLFRENTVFEQIEVYVLDCGISVDSKEKLLAVADQWKRQLYFVDMHGAVETLNLRMGAHKIAIASYARLFMASLLPEHCGKVLYIDCDTLVKDSLAPLWQLPLGDALIAGTQDTVDSYFLKAIGLPKAAKYINAGVLLANLTLWRQENLLAQSMELINRFEGNVPHHDQGTLNAVCGDRRLIIPLRFNVTANLYSFSARTIKRIYFLEDFYTQEELTEALQHPTVVHFTTGLLGRPWEVHSCHPERDAFLSTLAETPWKGLPLAQDSRRTGLKAFILFHQLMPTPVFELVYRSISWLLHLRK